MDKLLADAKAQAEKSIADAYQGHSTGDVASSYGRDEYNMGYGLEILMRNLEKNIMRNLAKNFIH